MVSKPPKTLQDLVKYVGCYPEEAFLFVRDGLNYAVDKVHGPEPEEHRAIHEYLLANDLDTVELIDHYHQGELPDPLVSAIDAGGGVDKLNRHVGGRDLCWGLRDYALKRWGMLARIVLESWKFQCTADFGKVVFGFINFDMMRKEPEDSVKDFEDVFDFTEAFDGTYRLDTEGGQATRDADN